MGRLSDGGGVGGYALRLLSTSYTQNLLPFIRLEGAGPCVRGNWGGAEGEGGMLSDGVVTEAVQRGHPVLFGADFHFHIWSDRVQIVTRPFGMYGL